MATLDPLLPSMFPTSPLLHPRKDSLNLVFGSNSIDTEGSSDDLHTATTSGSESSSAATTPLYQQSHTPVTPAVVADDSLAKDTEFSSLHNTTLAHHDLDLLPHNPFIIEEIHSGNSSTGDEFSGDETPSTSNGSNFSYNDSAGSSMHTILSNDSVVLNDLSLPVQPPVTDYHYLKEQAAASIIYQQQQANKNTRHQSPIVVQLPLPAVPISTNNKRQPYTIKKEQQYSPSISPAGSQSVQHQQQSTTRTLAAAHSPDDTSAEQAPVITVTTKAGSRRRRYVTANSSPLPRAPISVIDDSADDGSQDPNDANPGDKRERNKQSAASYRKRRKLYLDSLEATVDSLHTRISDQDEKLQTFEHENSVLKQQLEFMKKLLAWNNIKVLDDTNTASSSAESGPLLAKAVDKPVATKPAPFVGGGMGGSNWLTGSDFARQSLLLCFAVLAIIMLVSPSMVTDLADSMSQLSMGSGSYSAAGRKLFADTTSVVTETSHSLWGVVTEQLPQLLSQLQAFAYSIVSDSKASHAATEL